MSIMLSRTVVTVFHRSKRIRASISLIKWIKTSSSNLLQVLQAALVQQHKPGGRGKTNGARMVAMQQINNRISSSNRRVPLNSSQGQHLRPKSLLKLTRHLQLQTLIRKIYSSWPHQIASHRFGSQRQPPMHQGNSAVARCRIKHSLLSSQATSKLSA